MHLECKYCDNPMSPSTIDGDEVCSRCGAEWEDAKVLVEDDNEIMEFDNVEEDDDHDWDDDGHLDCGCCSCCGCSCSIDDEDYIEV